MKLIIDIGNTFAKLVAFDGDEPVDEFHTEGENLSVLEAFISKHTFEKGIFATVRGITHQAQQKLESLPFPMMQLTSDTPIPIRNHYRTPLTLGADRIAAAVGASSLKPGKDLLIIDAGTCITYEVIDAQGNYWGGNIAPGMHMRLHSLHEHTAKLPLIAPEGPVPGIGYDTETAIRSGVLRGMKYEIEGYIRSMRKKYPMLNVFLTGGDEINFDAGIKSIVFTDKYIVPRGLNKILDYQQETVDSLN